MVAGNNNINRTDRTIIARARIPMISWRSRVRLSVSPSRIFESRTERTQAFDLHRCVSIRKAASSSPTVCVVKRNQIKLQSRIQIEADHK